MEVLEAIRTVLAVRQFRDQAVPEPIVVRILEAGRLTASGGNQQPWQFIVVQHREILQKLGTLVKTAPYLAQAALAIVVGIEKGSKRRKALGEVAHRQQWGHPFA